MIIGALANKWTPSAFQRFVNHHLNHSISRHKRRNEEEKKEATDLERRPTSTT